MSNLLENYPNFLSFLSTAPNFHSSALALLLVRVSQEITTMCMFQRNAKQHDIKTMQWIKIPWTKRICQVCETEDCWLPLSLFCVYKMLLECDLFSLQSLFFFFWTFGVCLQIRVYILPVTMIVLFFFSFVLFLEYFVFVGRSEYTSCLSYWLFNFFSLSLLLLEYFVFVGWPADAYPALGDLAHSGHHTRESLCTI